MDLAGLSAFLAVADRRSFTAAAAALGVTPSAVSQAVRSLEDRTGVRLVQRTTRSVGLTEAGERFVARLRPALEGVETAFASLDEVRGAPAGTLRLNVPRIAYRHVLAPLLPELLALHSRLDIEVVVEDRFVDIVATGFDAGIRIGETLERDMIAIRLGGAERIAVVGAPSYFAKHGRPRRPADLRDHDCIRYRRVTSGEIYRWELTDGGKDVEIAVRGRVVTNDADVMITSARDGLGLAHLFESVVADDLASGRLVRVLEAYCPPFPGLYLYYPSRRHLAPKLEALVAFLRARLERPRPRPRPKPSVATARRPRDRG